MYLAELAKGDDGFGCFLLHSEGSIYVVPVSGSAKDAGLRVGDELLGVNGVNFRKGTTPDEVTVKLAATSRVELLLRRGSRAAAAPRLSAGEAGQARANWAHAQVEAVAHACALERESEQEEAEPEAAEKQRREAARLSLIHI